MTICAVLAGAGLFLAFSGRDEDVPELMFAGAGVVGLALALWYDPAIEAVLRRRRWPGIHDAGLWLLTSIVGLATCGAADLLLRPPAPDAPARTAWALSLVGHLLPLAPVLVTGLRAAPQPVRRPLLWPIAAGLGGSAIYWSAGWVTWSVVSAAIVDRYSVTPAAAVWLVPPIAPLLAIGGQYWWRALRRPATEPFDGRGMFRGVVLVEMAVLATILSLSLLLLLRGAPTATGPFAASRLVAWIMLATVVAAWLVALFRIRNVSPVRATGAIAAVAMLILLIGATLVVPVGFADAGDWWQLLLLLFAPVVLASAVGVIVVVPRLSRAALGHRRQS